MKPNISVKPLSDWELLRRRYSSSRAYKARTALSVICLDGFSNWLVDQGADVFSKTEQHEILRFKLNGELGIWYASSGGNLLMHNLAEKFKVEATA